MELFNLDNLSKISRFIFWIDNQIKNGENQYYLNYLKKEFPKYTIETFDSINNLEYFLKKEKKVYDFKFVYIIISGSLAEEFFNIYNNLTYINIIAATIIFCGNKSQHSSKPYANDLYLNPGGIVSTFEEVIEYINNPNDQLWHRLKAVEYNSILPPKKVNNSGNKFIFAKDLSEITLPIILTQIIKKNLIHGEDIYYFEEFTFSKYRFKPDNEGIIPLIKPSLEKQIYIPLSKFSKFLLRLYTLSSDFYRELNENLINFEGFGPYKALILIFYFSIQNKSLNSYIEKKLYRGDRLLKTEMDEIIKNINIKKNNVKSKNEISSPLYYSKRFLSFSKSRSIAENYLKKGGENKVTVLLILNPPKFKDKIYFSNIDIDQLNISAFAHEQEVLFLPYSCFEIEDFKIIGESLYEITLNYLDKYYEQLEETISSNIESEDLKLFYEKVLESPFSKKVFESFNDEQNLLDNIKDFFSNNIPIENVNLNINKIIPKLPHDKLIPNFNENASTEGLPPGYSNGKQLNELYRTEPISFQLQKNKKTGNLVWEMKYRERSKTIIKNNINKGKRNTIHKKFDELGRYGYYDEAYEPLSKEIKIEKVNTEEVLHHSKDFNMAEVKELSLLRSGYTSANLIGNSIGYNLANFDNFMKLSNTDKIKSLGATIGLSILMSVLSNTAKNTSPFISVGLLGGFYIYDLASDIKSKALTKSEIVISILKNCANLAVNTGIGIGSFYAGLEIGTTYGITSGSEAIMMGLGTGLFGGLVEGLFGRLINSKKMTLNCNSFYNNYIPLKFRLEGNIPDLFLENINRNAKSLAIEAIIDKKFKTWSVINIPPLTRKITKDVGETLIKYENFMKYNPNIVEYILFSLKKEKITEEEWNEKNIKKELIIEVATLEVKNL